jgi:hypothetical protein
MITRLKGIVMPEFLVDTCIWSEVLRRKKPNPVISEHLAKMLRNLQAVLIGPVRQEILSGISDEAKSLKQRQ